MEAKAAKAEEPAVASPTEAASFPSSVPAQGARHHFSLWQAAPPSPLCALWRTSLLSGFNTPYSSTVLTGPGGGGRGGAGSCGMWLETGRGLLGQSSLRAGWARVAKQQREALGSWHRGCGRAWVVRSPGQSLQLGSRLSVTDRGQAKSFTCSHERKAVPYARLMEQCHAQTDVEHWDSLLCLLIMSSDSCTARRERKVEERMHNGKRILTSRHQSSYFKVNSEHSGNLKLLSKKSTRNSCAGTA